MYKLSKNSYCWLCWSGARVIENQFADVQIQLYNNDTNGDGGGGGLVTVTGPSLDLFLISRRSTVYLDSRAPRN